MAVPSAQIAEVAAGPPLVPATNAKICVTFGTCSRGTKLQPIFWGTDLSALTTASGCGPGVKASAYVGAKTGVSGIFLPLPTTPITAFTSPVDTSGVTGTLVPTVTGTPNARYDVIVLFTVAGTVGTAGISYQISTNGGRTFANAVALGTATSITITGTGMTLTLTSTETVNVNDQVVWYSLPPYPAILPATITYAGATMGTITPSGTPNDYYDILVNILTGGTTGTAGIVFEYSQDGGYNWSPAQALGTSSTFTLLDGPTESSGVVLTFSGDFTAGDELAFSTTGPEWQASDAQTALNNLRASQYQWGFLHGAGTVDPTKIGTIGSLMASWAAGTKFTFCLGSAREWGVSSNETEDNWINRLLAPWSTYADTRVAIGAGYARITCPITGRQNRRPCTWPAVARLVGIAPQIDLGQKSGGVLTSDVLIYDVNGNLAEYDARINSALFDARFITIRSFDDEPGVWIARGNLMGPADDIQRLAYRRVLNIVNQTYQAQLLELIESSFRRYPSTVKSPYVPGNIVNADLKRMNRAIQTALNAAVVATGMVSAIQVQINPTPQSIGPGAWQLNAQVKITGLGYIDQAVGQVGFVDPTLDTILNKPASS